MASRFKENIRSILLDSGIGIAFEIKDELKDQGHSNTGKLVNSVKPTVTVESESINLDITMLDYHTYLEHGVRASRIPFGGKKTGRGKSKYIEGLIAYFKSKGRSLKQAKAAAFATAHKHKEEGMPTRGSKRFSNNGRRLNFITESTKASKEIDLTAELILDSLNLEGIKILDSFEKSIR